jgi:hypothetical protein
MHEEGWHIDPFGQHEARWISDGTPTSLVRDDGVESKDPPPDAPYSGTIQPLPDASQPDDGDLIRTGGAEPETVRQRQSRELSVLFDQIGWPGSDGPGI